MSEDFKNEGDNPSDKALTNAVWPPEIEHSFEDSTVPVVLTKAQMHRVRYFWFHVLAVPLSLMAGTEEYLSTSPGWWQTSLYKVTILCLCLLGFVGNLWRACQGWQIKTVLDLHRHE